MPRGTYFFTYGLPAASSLKSASGLGSRYAARFLLAPRPFVQPTLPVRAVQAGLALPNGEEEGEADPDGSRLLRRLRDQERKQRSLRECDSPLLIPVGSGNRTFPGRQPLPVLRTCKKPGVLFKPTVIHKIRTPGSGRNFRRVKRRIAGLPRGRRPARPLTRKLILIVRINGRL